MSESSTSTEQTRPRGVLSRLGALLALELLLYLYYPTLYETALIAWSDEDYSHGLLLPFISAYLIWDLRKQGRLKRSEVTPRFSWLGLLLLGGGLLLYFVGRTSELHYPTWVSFFPTLIGTVFLLFGTRQALPLALPLGLNIMAKPLPDVLLPKLFGSFQALAARTSATLLDRMEIPVHLLGNIIEVPGMKLLVEEACSGMRSIMALLTVAMLVIYLTENHAWVRILIVVLSVALALALNVLRVTVTGLMAYSVGPAAAQGFMHSFSGMVTFIVGLVVLYATAELLHRLTWKGAEKL